MASHFALTRILDDGTADFGFGDGGRVVTDFRRSAEERAEAVAIDSAGRIVVAGQARVGAGSQLAVARYRPDGSLDHSFHHDGKVLTNFWTARHEGASALAVDGRNRVVVGGWAMIDDRFQFALARYKENGSLDHGFDRDGKVLTDIETSDRELATAIALDHQHRIVAAGWAQGGEAEAERFALARYLDDGALDPSFRGGAFEAVLQGTRSARAHSVTVDDEGRILVAGWATLDDVSHFALARFREDGAHDPDFGVDGYVLTAFPGARLQQAHDVAVDDRGRIVVGGTAAIDDDWRIAVARYRADGALDEDFADRGRLLTAVQRRDSALANAMALDGRFRIVLAGWAGRPGPPQFALARYNDTGTPDERFGDGGTVTAAFDRASMQEATAVAIDPGGRIVIAGYARMAED